MTRRALERILWSVALASIAVSIIEWHRAPSTRYAPSSPLLRSSPVWIDEFGGDVQVHAAVTLVEANPFRFDRGPASVRYQAELEGSSGPPSPATPPKPTLVLRGIVGGPPWEAMVDGIPGRQGSVLIRQGDTLGQLDVRAISRDTVTIRGADTTWKLAMKRSW
jgi:hypothetical protein